MQGRFRDASRGRTTGGGGRRIMLDVRVKIFNMLAECWWKSLQGNQVIELAVRR